jgi:hypothetical protein
MAGMTQRAKQQNPRRRERGRRFDPGFCVRSAKKSSIRWVYSRVMKKEKKGKTQQLSQMPA